MTLLESDFGAAPDGSRAVHAQYLLDALDRGEHARFIMWPGHDPLAVLYAASTGAMVPAGSPAAGQPLAEVAERIGWRILIGDAPLATAILDAYPRGLFRRRPAAREQRFMAVRAGEPLPPSPPAPEGLRRGRLEDLGRVVELACLLHVEDRMGPPIPRSGRAAVRDRMLDSLARGMTWVVERDGRVVGKLDLSLHSRRRGAQIAGVYVEAPWRGQGITAGAVATLRDRLLDDGLPAVSLHVRSDNTPALRAYSRAGLRDVGAWTLAFR